ncbi:hypothetical protein [Sanguibacter sp. 25GB23B1]|uniref:hypothetical protein n=1 Tax=unclassified Sanguibacter TaxID=2645534 RepID=UPI0032AF76C1
MTAGPHVEITSFDVGPEELTDQLPVTARLLRMLPGPDRPDYALAVATRPLRFTSTVDALAAQGIPVAGLDPQCVHVETDGTVRATVFGLVMAPRIVGQALHPTMVDFPVALAVVIDPTQMRDPSIDFSKCSYVAVAFVTTVRSDGERDT